MKPTLVVGNHGLEIFRYSHILPWAPPSRSNDGSLALVNCLSGGYKFASVLQCARSSYFYCLCMGDLQAPPAPHFVFLITL